MLTLAIDSRRLMPSKGRTHDLRGNQGLTKSGRKRELPIAKSPQLNIDVPALFFGAIIIVFVLWPAAQWALGL